jgi:hypothetical protein
VLKPGGQAVVGLVDRDSPLGTKYQEHKTQHVFYREATFYSVAEVVSYLSPQRGGVQWVHLCSDDLPTFGQDQCHRTSEERLM